MQIIYDAELTHIQIDGEKVKDLLLQHGVPEVLINPLRIYVQHAPSEKQRKSIQAQGDGSNGTGGLHHGNDIYLFTNNRPSPMGPSLNRTLLHELRHHIKCDYQPGESKLPYAQRPSEIDAFAFADQYARQHTLLTIPGESPFTPLEDKLLSVLAAELVIIGLLGVCAVSRWLLKKALA